ncbi:iron-sulfur cluster co-chaperone protein HscB, mitochondrial-like isoform X1 [Eurytemora carolleeae]|uniref:iron-sulfur cluster co-chaperone protein HscB, mitochondrial-like isoform X1 n=1 Tax=Eurytemora carolleeae TaxID=1294199 RepID=UPI000C757096|nr:iron-sulfur cluster co-chaperone protein HscB, mitochondrial-like isoform X1 [Eurytemora carolleeae]|eukprot:XP_023334505.1 iron-sulfur cluster co-chaperone protein HscB, mitochondrial-like isoform X1 [Eurytemora affinis]
MEKILLLSMPSAQRLARAYTQTTSRLFVLNTNSIKLVQIRMNSQNKGFLDLFDENGKLKEPPKNLDYFSIFGLEKSFALDTAELSRVYKGLQRQLHPDRFSLKPEEEKDISEHWSSIVNNGYNWLLKPLPRALYLLELLGTPLEEGHIQIQSDFLMEMMELNEDILSADKAEIISLGKEIRVRLNEYIDKIETAFRDGNTEEARNEVAHMKYIANMLDKIIEIETKLEID